MNIKLIPNVINKIIIKHFNINNNYKCNELHVIDYNTIDKYYRINVTNLETGDDHLLIYDKKLNIRSNDIILNKLKKDLIDNNKFTILNKYNIVDLVIDDENIKVLDLSNLNSKKANIKIYKPLDKIILKENINYDNMSIEVVNNVHIDKIEVIGNEINVLDPTIQEYDISFLKNLKSIYVINNYISNFIILNYSLNKCLVIVDDKVYKNVYKISNINDLKKFITGEKIELNLDYIKKLQKYIDEKSLTIDELMCIRNTLENIHDDDYQLLGLTKKLKN